MRKRVLSLCMALAMCLSLLPIHISAGELKDIAQSVEDDKAETPEATLESVSDDTKTNEVDVKSDATGDIQNLHTITGVQWDDAYSYIRLEQIISLDEVQTLLPTTLSVYLDKGIQTTTIPVSWEIESKVVQSTTAYYNLRPVLSGYMDTDILPCIHVEMGDESSNQSAYLLNGGSLFTDDKIQSRIDTLYDLLGGKFFTVNQESCTTKFQGGHGCDNCYSTKIVEQQWFKSLFGTVSTSQFPASAGYTQNGYSCLGFAHFAEWYIFRESDNSAVTTYTVTNCNFNFDNISQYAKIGDLMRLGGKHSVIFISADSNGIYVLDCNGVNETNGQCKVRKHTFQFRNSPYSTVLISRAPNSAPPDPNQHTHQVIRKNSTGVCVRELQEMLNKLINAGLDTDGNFGPATESKLKEYQRNAGLTVDGVCGPATWAALTKDINNIQPSPPTARPVAPSAPSVHINGYGEVASVTISWNGVENAAYYDVYLVQEPWGWENIKYSSDTRSTSFTFEGIALGRYNAFVISRPNENTVQSGWTGLVVPPVPSGEWMSVNKESVLTGEEITFAYGATDATSYYIGIDRDGSRILSQYVPASGFTTNFSDPGQYSAYVTCANTNGFVDSNRVSFTVNPPKYYLDVNGYLDGTAAGSLGDYGTVDVYINDSRVADDVSDYYAEWLSGTNYEIRDIKPKAGYSYDGVYEGVRTGSIGSGTATTTFKFSKIDATNLPTAEKTETFNGHTYSFYSGQVTWYAAKLLCESMGGHLVTITSEEENQFVHSLRGENRVWLGATHASGAWEWITGEGFSYDKWAAGEWNNDASNDEGSENYAEQAYWDATWNDLAGYIARGFVCEIDSAPTLDVNGYLDGAAVGGLLDYGTVDVYINGSLVADDVSDYYKEWLSGTNYEIRDIKPKPGYSYDGVYEGARTGSIGSGAVSITFKFSKIDTINLPTAAKTATFNGHTYSFYSEQVTWYAAKLLCESMGGHLVTITSEEENQFILSLRGDNRVWIGATDATPSEKWEWITGEPFSYDRWAAEEPNNDKGNDEGNENYAEQAYGDATWNDAPGYTIRGFVCEIDSTTKLDINGYLDGVAIGDLVDYGTVDVYINGSRVADDVSDYYAEWLSGTGYEIRDIKPKAGYSYDGIYEGVRTGSIGSGTATTTFKFSKIDTASLPTAAKTATFNGHAYSFYSEPVTWYAAKLLCESMGGHLVTISGEEENQFLLSLRGENRIWIGATDATPSEKWEWITGEPFAYDKWAAEEPNNDNGNDEGNENYAEQVYGDATWNDLPGYVTRGFVCEIDRAKSAEPEIMIVNKSASRGATVKVPVTIKNNPGIAGAMLTVSYDKSALTLNDMIKGALFEKGSYNANSETGVVQWYHTENITDDGVLFTLQFVTNASAQNGNYNISVGLRDGIPANLSNADSNIVNAQFISGVLEITSGIRGDVTGDGVVAINDVVKLARAVAGNLTLTEAETAVADVTGDGVIAINDVVKLARYVAGNLASLQSAEAASLSGGETAVIEVATVSGKPGETVRIPVSITNNPGIAGLQLDVLFDNALTLKNVIQGDILSGEDFTPDVSAGRVQWYYNQGNVTNTGVLFTLEFEVSAEARNGNAYAVTVNVKDRIAANLSDYDANPVNAEFKPGKVQISETSSAATINTVSRNENTITANVVCSDSNASVFCGVYNNSGKMIAVRSVQVTNESNYQFQFDGQQVDYAKVFILDSNLCPLCGGKKS